jgi:hypothetical protein
MPDTSEPQAHWKAEFDLTMEQIRKTLAETKRIMDGVEEPRRPQLTLVRTEEADDGQR